MIEILLKNKEIVQLKSTDEFSSELMDFYAIQFIDYTEQEIIWAKEYFGIDCSLMKHYEDIEISSHFLVKNNQTAFHISVPYYSPGDNTKLVEAHIFFVMSDKGLFFFSTSALDKFFYKKYFNKFNEMQKISNLVEILMYQLEFISDYYADIAENEAKRVKKLGAAVLLESNFSNEIADLITQYNFNNLLLKESLIETIRVFGVYKKTIWHEAKDIKERINSELKDLVAVSDYIQFSFERLDNMNTNVTNKINLEQNHIFKVLTIITLCISLPTVIAGIYGMNFVNMPELNWSYGYPLTMVAMLLSVILPYIYFKRKKWF